MQTTNPISRLVVAFALLILPTALPSQVVIDQLFPNLVFTRAQFDSWKQAIADDTQTAAYDAYTNHIRLLALKTVRDELVPAPVASLTGASTALVEADMKRMYTLCVYYAFTLNETYLNKAREYYLAWAAINNAVKENSPSETIYTPAIEGYSIIRNVLDETSRTTIDGWMRRRAAIAQADRVRPNNWETIRLQFIQYYGYVLNDQSLLNNFTTGLNNFIPINIYPNGTTEDLLGRDAFAYHAYNLLFYARILRAEACYKGFAAADALYAAEYKWGSSIKKAVDFWKPYLLYPEKYSHIEFVETEWSPDQLRSDFNKPYNPGGTIYAIDELYLFDKELYECIRKYRGNTYNATLPLWLSAIRWLYL